MSVGDELPSESKLEVEPRFDVELSEVTDIGESEERSGVLEAGRGSRSSDSSSMLVGGMEVRFEKTRTEAEV